MCAQQWSVEKRSNESHRDMLTSRGYLEPALRTSADSYCFLLLHWLDSTIFDDSRGPSQEALWERAAEVNRLGPLTRIAAEWSGTLHACSG